VDRLRLQGIAAEVAAGYAFLASADAAYLTGRTLQLDGGFF
jgi:NAD(P)-dependent dehydrogenase (short-subunit alcohol dehydrogenase family)